MDGALRRGDREKDFFNFRPGLKNNLNSGPAITFDLNGSIKLLG
jgi:hypothetical protein